MTNLNSIYFSFINNISFTDKSSTETKSKDISSTLFATRIENSKKTDTYLNEIKNNYPNTTVNIKSMTAGDVQNYYNEWKKQPVNYSGFSHTITISPKVLEKMEKDPKYAEQMLVKINKATIPEGFDNAILYEYKVIVRDDGEIETMACADFNNEKKLNTDDDDEKEKAKKKRIEKKKAAKDSIENMKLEFFYENKRIYEQWKSQHLLEEKIKINNPINEQYLFHTAVINKAKNRNNVID